MSSRGAISPDAAGAAWRRRLRAVDPVRRSGRVGRIHATHIEADGPNVPLGTLCAVETHDRGGSFLAEVVRIDRDNVVLSPLEEGRATFSGAAAVATAAADRIAAGPTLLGRVIDALGRPLDGGPTPVADDFHPLYGEAPSPLARCSPQDLFRTGVRAIDGLLTLGKGQRVGIFAASGVGKTSLVGQIARQADADAIVFALIGERGREVEALWHDGLSAEARARATVIAATSDQPAAMRVRAGFHALALADHIRAQGKHVLLVLDSVTRLAMAMREIGLAAGEPPTVRAYTPNVFAAIPRLVERSGALRAGGAITAIMTVLSETDEVDDPICEMMKSLLDGHIVLSRTLAEQGHFPAIDVCRSVSRQAEELVSATEGAQMRRIAGWLSLHDSSRTLRESGLYAAGANSEVDAAVAHYPEIIAFLRQGRHESASLSAIRTAMMHVAGGEG